MRILLFLLVLTALQTTSSVEAQTQAGDCTPTPTTLCLNNNRFQVEVEWFDEAGNPGTVSDFTGGGFGRNTPVSDVWTGMWFFDADNLELLVHIFQGCGNNDRYWVFAGGLTNVEVTLTVTDTQTGESSEYFNPLGTPFEPITDTGAFATCPKSMPLATLPDLPKQQAPPAEQLLGLCAADSTTACLRDGRFELTLSAFGSDQTVQVLADGTAGFQFGNPSFFDVFARVVDGRSSNGNYWIDYFAFPGTASFTLTVRDLVEGTSQTYDYLSSDPFYVQDIAAFQGDPFVQIDGTLSGSWFAEDRDGEGFIFDVSTVNGVPTLVLYYFTYTDDDSGQQAWMVGAAPIIGDSASVPVVIASGAQFGSGFDPADVVRTDWGNVKVTFLSCDRVRIETDSTLFQSVSYEAGRLTPAPIGVQGTCQGTAAKGLTVDGGYSGSWYRVERDGEGFIFNIAEIGGQPTLVVFYFTYENNTSGRQAWLVGSAPIQGNRADVPLVVTSGTRFGSGFDPGDVVRSDAGQVTVIWQDCDSASVQITSPLGNLSFDIIALTLPPIGATGACPG